MKLSKANASYMILFLHDVMSMNCEDHLRQARHRLPIG